MLSPLLCGEILQFYWTPGELPRLKTSFDSGWLPMIITLRWSNMAMGSVPDYLAGSALQVISWFLNPINDIVVIARNPSYVSYKPT
jgi:hypothetical protein